MGPEGWAMAGVFIGYVVGQISERLLAFRRDRSSFSDPARAAAAAPLVTSADRARDERLEEIRSLEWEDHLEALERLKERRRKRESADASLAAPGKLQDRGDGKREAQDMVAVASLTPKERARLQARRQGVLP